MARRQIHSIKQMQVPASSLQNGSPEHRGSSSSTKVSDHNAAITLGIIMGVFLFCWAPFFTINIVSAFCPTCIPPIVFSIFTWLGYFNSTLNPIIYSIFNQEFRAAFKRVLSMEKCCADRHNEFRCSIRFNSYISDGAYGTVITEKTPMNQDHSNHRTGLTSV